MSYLDFYGLKEEPFANVPVASKMFYNSAQHSQAMLRMMFAVDSMKGLAMVVGGIGSGKTTLARRMLDQLPDEEYEAAMLVIIHSAISADWLLRRIATLLGVEEPPHDKATIIGLIYERLKEIHEAGKKAVILVDEVQMLQTREIMEEFRGLLNLEVPGKKLLTFVFFGLPEVEDHLKLDEPLNQRVAVKYHLKALSLDSTESYIKHRLHVAGATRMFFSREAVENIYKLSRGIPRLINTISDNALFEGYVLKKEMISEALIESIGKDLRLDENSRAEFKKTVAARNEKVEQTESLDEIDSILDKLTE